MGHKPRRAPSESLRVEPFALGGFVLVTEHDVVVAGVYATREQAEDHKQKLVTKELQKGRKS